MARKKGDLNRLNGTIKEAFEKVFHLLQKDDKHSLFKWAKDNPTEFYKIASKFIPAAIEADITENKITRIEIVMADDRTNAPLDFAAETADGTTITSH